MTVIQLTADGDAAVHGDFAVVGAAICLVINHTIKVLYLPIKACQVGKKLLRGDFVLLFDRTHAANLRKGWGYVQGSKSLVSSRQVHPRNILGRYAHAVHQAAA